MYFISAENNLSGSSGNILTTFRIDGYSGWPGTMPSFVRVKTFTTPSSFSSPPDASQPGTSTNIETGDDRLLTARAYGGDIWATQGCAIQYTNVNAGLCLYGVTTNGVMLFDPIRYGTPDYDDYYPSIALDRNESVGIVFSRSSATHSEYASIRYTGMRPDEDTLESSVRIKAGEDVYVNLDAKGKNRWGDYTGIERDPGNGLTFWMFNEYAKPQVSGTGRWSTWIYTAYFPNQLFLPLTIR